MPSLDVTELARSLVRPNGLWRDVRVVPRTGSTNADLLREARSGAGEGVVLVAETQTAGRGRLGRHWISQPGAALTFSVLLRPAGVAPGLLGWLPLLAGVSTAAAVHQVAGVDARLKWPNDVLAGHGKLAGILAESSDGRVVVGFGINVSARHEDLPVPTATSVLVEAAREPGRWPGGAAVSLRERLLVAILEDLAARYRAWRDQALPGDADACGLRQEYLQASATLGRVVTVTLPGGRTLTGTATGVDASGRLEVDGPEGVVPVSAGDVVHVR